MKKIFTLSLLLAFSVLAVNAQLPVSTAPALKNAILEEFTGIKCVFCPDGHKIAAQIVANNPNRAYVVNIHTGGFAVPSAGQPDFRIPEGDAIRLIPNMNVTGYPQGAVNRRIYTGASYAMGRGTWTAAVNAALAQPSYVNVAGEATLNVITNELTVNIEAYYTGNSPQPTNKLTVMLLQNNINGPQTGGATYNPTMMNLDGTYRHMHALRDVISAGGATGEDISPTTTGTLITKTINYTVPTIIGNIPVSTGDLELLVFVAQGVVEIQTVAKVPITYTGLTTVNNGAVMDVNAEACISSVTPSFQLKNMGSAAITSATISYSANGGTPVIHNWVGNIPSLGSEDITLPAIAYTIAGTNTMDISATLVNGVSDDDPSDNSASSNFTASTATSPTLNLTLNLVQDRYGDEITWKFFNSAGTQVAAGGPYTILSANGTLLHTINVVLPANDCYKFELYDSYGDGINSGYGVGSATILDGNGGTLFYTNGTYTSSVSLKFDAGFVGINEAPIVNGINIYPNPIQNVSNISFELAEASEVKINIVNTVGQTIMQNNLGKVSAGAQSFELDATSLSNGLYFVELSIGNNTFTRKISVNK